MWVVRIMTMGWATEEQAVKLEWSVLGGSVRMAENRGIQKQPSGAGDGRTASTGKPVKRFNHRPRRKICS